MTTRHRVGILGGTFDPIHIGHLHIAVCARHELALDQVVFMPAGSPPHKPKHPVTSGELRLHMINTAIEGNAGLQSSDLDLQHDFPSYTSGLLARYREKHPGTDIWFIIGSDSLLEFPAWHEPNTILQSARLAVAERPGWTVSTVLDQVRMPKLRESVDVFTSVPIDLSATSIRARLSRGLPVTWLVPSPVLDVIDRNHIYQGDVDTLDR